METEQQKPDYVIAADELAAIIARCGIDSSIEQTRTNRDGSRMYACYVRRMGGDGMACSYQCGGACKEPNTQDVLAALLADDACIEGHADWLDWADEFGYQKATELREASDAFQTISGRRADLRRLLGAGFDAARDAAGRL
jgi:hypothetical protein